MYEIIRWVTLVILWICIAGNVWAIISLRREHKRTKEIMRQTIEVKDKLDVLVCEFSKRLTTPDE